MNRERKDRTSQATELVDQIYPKMVAAKDRDWRNRQQFFAIAARAMRGCLIDHTRGRPDAEFVGLEGLENLAPSKYVEAGDGAHDGSMLDQLSRIKPECSTLMEIKYFLGLTDEEAAEALALRLRTMQRMWHDARQWLFKQIEPPDAS